MQAQLPAISAGQQFSPALSSGIRKSLRSTHRPTVRPSSPRLLQALATIQGNVAPIDAGTQLVNVKLVLVRRCDFGQQFKVVGDDASFGAWDPVASIPMQWSEGHTWTTNMEVCAGKRVEFKVILMGGQTVLDWQPGPNRVLETSEASTSPLILETQWAEDLYFEEDGLQSKEIADIDSVIETMESEQISSGLVATENELNHEVEVLHNKQDCIKVDGEPVDTSAKVSESGAQEFLTGEANKDPERKLSVLEKDLKWCRATLSMILGTSTKNGNKEA